MSEACKHCGSSSKFHPVSARYCKAYQLNEIEALESRLAEAQKGWESTSRLLKTQTQEFDTVGRQAHTIEIIEAKLALAVEALNRALPVMKWLRNGGEDTVGCSVANQVQPIIEAALASIAQKGGSARSDSAT